jgi:hypothetical protein
MSVSAHQVTSDDSKLGDKFFWYMEFSYRNSEKSQILTRFGYRDLIFGGDSTGGNQVIHQKLFIVLSSTHSSGLFLQPNQQFILVCGRDLSSGWAENGTKRKLHLWAKPGQKHKRAGNKRLLKPKYHPPFRQRTEIWYKNLLVSGF